MRQYSEQESAGGGQFTMQEYRRSGQYIRIAGVQEWAEHTDCWSTGVGLYIQIAGLQEWAVHTDYAGVQE